jgi:hypothetical protein
MTGRFAAIAPADVLQQRLERIGHHLELLAQGYDPQGRLLAIERLSRAARSEWRSLQGPTTHKARS